MFAPRQNLFFRELQHALAVELDGHGVRASLHLGVYPPPRRGLIYAVMPPHEYFTLMHGRIGPPTEVHDRTIFICAEQPNTEFFDTNLRIGPMAGAVFDINRWAVRAFAEEGLPAQHLQLGYTSAWDFMRDEGHANARDIDVLFMGAASERRLRHLASYVEALRNRTCRWVISDGSRPNWAPSGSFVTDTAKWDLLRRSKLVLNLHQGDIPYFEWLRIVQAMANGCVVVSEASLDSEPLLAGEHLVVGRAGALPHLSEWLLEEEGARRRIQATAYDFLRQRLPLSASAQRLAETAHRLDERPVPSAHSRFFLQPPPRDEDVDARISELGAPDPVTELGVRRALKDLRIELLELRRRIDRSAVERSGGTNNLRLHAKTRGWWSARPRVSVLVALYNYERHIEFALDSLLTSTERTWEVVIVDDGSTDGSLQRAARWLARHDELPAMLVTHPVNRGLAQARNAALDFARGEYCFVLDADNILLPAGLGALVTPLDDDPGAAFAYGHLQQFSPQRIVGLSNIYPWEPERFKDGNYIDAMALIRTSLLRAHGGYRTDPRLYGWEDFDLWARFGEAGLRGLLVPTVVARYRTTDHSMLSITNISAVDAISVIAEASPTVMAGASAPY